MCQKEDPKPNHVKGFMCKCVPLWDTPPERSHLVIWRIISSILIRQNLWQRAFHTGPPSVPSGEPVWFRGGGGTSTAVVLCKTGCWRGR